MKTPLLFLVACLLSQPIVRAQSVVPDTVATGVTEGNTRKTDPSFVMQKSPLGAVLRSAVLPGWGQYYNESYWKIPLVLGVSGVLVYGIITEHRDYTQWRDLYATSITEQNPSGNLEYKRFREFYRDRRDTYAWYFGLFYLLQIADAFVDAHLFDFSVSPDLSASLSVLPEGRVGLSLRW